MADPISIGAIIIAVVGALASLITSMHIRKCKSPICETDCSKDPNSPTGSIKKPSLN